MKNVRNVRRYPTSRSATVLDYGEMTRTSASFQEVSGAIESSSLSLNF
jgi:hypothetical protein